MTMTTILIIFMIIILAFALIMVSCAASRGTLGNRKDSSMYDENDNHRYYDRSIIEKEEFAKRNPEVKDVRTLRRLFGQHKNR